MKAQGCRAGILQFRGFRGKGPQKIRFGDFFAKASGCAHHVNPYGLGFRV